MQKIIKLQNQDIAYNLKISSRARRLRLAIKNNGDFVVTVPQWMRVKVAEDFIIKKSAWVLKKLLYFKNNPSSISPREDRKQYLKYKEEARFLAQERLIHFNKFYKFKYGRISIRNQKTRWGSCSRQGNLNFNYRIVLLPPSLSDYIIVHELCHLKELNHSSRFWKLVAQTIPNYLDLRKELKHSLNNYLKLK